MPEVKARDRRRISGFVEDLATQRSGKRAGRSRSDFFNGLLRGVRRVKHIVEREREVERKQKR